MPRDSFVNGADVADDVTDVAGLPRGDDAWPGYAGADGAQSSDPWAIDSKHGT
jgi:hypothetical protein